MVNDRDQFTGQHDHSGLICNRNLSSGAIPLAIGSVCHAGHCVRVLSEREAVRDTSESDRLAGGLQRMGLAWTALRWPKLRQLEKKR